MKLFIVTCLKEYLGDITKIFKEANIDVFSTSEVIGHKQGENNNLLDDWFASGGEKADSTMIITFTSSANAKKGMELIKIYNETHDENFPVRPFVMAVEKFL